MGIGDIFIELAAWGGGHGAEIIDYLKFRGLNEVDAYRFYQTLQRIAEAEAADPDRQ